jgi:hypothetical protein
VTGGEGVKDSDWFVFGLLVLAELLVVGRYQP